MTDLQEMRNRVANLEEESFGAAGINPALLLGSLRLAVEVWAESKDILHLVLSDEELVARGMPAYAPLEKPELAIGANQLQLSTYTARLKEWSAEHTPFKELKQKLYATFWVTVKDIVNEVVGGRQYGISRRDIRQIFVLLSAEYGTITINETAAERAKLEQVWNPDSSFLDFLVNFTAIVNFLAEKGQPISSSEQILFLQKAVAHAPSFTMANAMFYQAHPLPAQQTLAALVTIYKNHFRTMVMTATAQTTGFTNQVFKPTSPNEALIRSVTDQIRLKLGTSHVSEQQGLQMQLAIAKAVASVMEPRPVKTNMCQKHPGSAHTWKECSKNPINAKK